jgi:ketosteroid isomerase-like protein
MRKLFIAVATVIAVGVGVLVGALAVPEGSSASSASEQEMRREADLWQISQLQQNFHKATSTKDIDLMMSLWAPNATFTVADSTAVGKEQIREFWLTDHQAFKPEINWISDTASYKVRINVNGDRGTLYYECHYVDTVTQEVVATTAADVDVARIDGRWLITSLTGASATLGP